MGSSGWNDFVTARWQGYSHQQLYDMLHSGPGSQAAGTAVDRWSGLSGALADIQQDISTGITSSGANWVGSAADTARGALGPLGDWAEQASTAAEVMRVSTEMQGDLLGKARADMPAPIPDPPAPTSIAQLMSAQVDHEIREAANNAAEQRAFQVMAEYESGTADNTSTLGDFGQPPSLNLDTTPISAPVTRRLAPVRRSARAGGPTVAKPGATEPSVRRSQSPATVEAEHPVTAGQPGEPAVTRSGGIVDPVPTEPVPTEPVPTGTSSSVPSTGSEPQPPAPKPVPPSPVEPVGGAPVTGAPTTGRQIARTTPSSATSPVEDGPVQRRTTAPGPHRTDTDPGGTMVPSARRPGQFGEELDEFPESRHLLEGEDIFGDYLTAAPPVIGENPRRRR